MVLKLYGAPFSTATKRVALVLNEKKVPFEFVYINMAQREHKANDYLTHQPFGQVPYIDDEGFTLYESRAICQYIAAKYADQGTQLVPKDTKEHAIYLQGVAIELSHFDPPISKLAYEKRVKPHFLGLSADEAVVSHAVEMLNTKLDVYEKILSKQKFIGGDVLTLADLFHLPMGALLPSLGCDAIEKRPAVSRWFNELVTRRAWKAVEDDIKSTA